MRFQLRLSRRFVMLMMLVSCTEATGPIDPLAALVSDLAKGPVSFVLAQVGEQVREPAITFDHECAAGHLTVAIHDTLTLSANGTARRATRTFLTLNGTAQPGSANVASGLWRPVTQPNLGYYSASPSLQATFWIGPDSIPVDLMVRLRGTTELTHLGGLGGSCPGSTDDTRQAEFVFTRR
jgi:hypothetical protein